MKAMSCGEKYNKNNTKRDVLQFDSLDTNRSLKKLSITDDNS